LCLGRSPCNVPKQVCLEHFKFYVFCLWYFVKHFADFCLLKFRWVDGDGSLCVLQPVNDKDIAMEYTQQDARQITQEIATHTSYLILFRYIADLIQNGADLKYI
jgi:hypothetical protein